jgi:hypothetical protein
MKLKGLIFTLLFLSFFFIASLPTFLSSKVGKNLVTQLIRKKGIKNFSADSLSFTWFGPQKIKGLKASFNNLDISAEGLETNLFLWEGIKLNKINKESLFKFKLSASIKNGSFQIIQNGSSASLTNINGSITPQTALSTFDIFLKGKSSEGNEKGEFEFFATLNKNSYIGNLKLANFPTITLDEIILASQTDKKGAFSTILGPTTDLSFLFNFTDASGKLDIDLTSTNVNTKFSAIYSNNSITLDSSLDAKVNLTESLSRYFLKEINPLLIYSARGYSPIDIHIPQNGLYLPLHPFQLDELKLDNARIDLGKIRTKNGENLNTIISLMKYHFLQNVEEMDVWCTPAFIKIDKGILYSSRMDLLLDDTIHICTWGSVNLIHQKVKMTLGLTSQALKKSFGIEELPPDYVMQIPLKGTTTNLKINKKQAAGKIAALIALETVDKQTSLGRLLRSLKKDREEQSKIPPPSLPFPWENRN